MKKLRTLYLSCNDPSSPNYNHLTNFDSMAQLDTRIIEFLREDSRLIVPPRINIEEGPFTYPKISSYIFSEFMNAFIDYFSYKHFGQETKRLSDYNIYLGILSEDPNNVSNFLKRNFYGIHVESENYFEKQFEEVSPCMVRDKKHLPYIYTPQELRQIFSNLITQRKGLDQDIRDGQRETITDLFVNFAAVEFMKNFQDLIKMSTSLHQ